MGGFTTTDGRRLEHSTAGDRPVLVCHPGGPGFSSPCGHFVFIEQPAAFHDLVAGFLAR